MPSDVTLVLVDGVEQPIVDSEGVAAILFERDYKDYVEALSSPQIEFVFMAGTATRNTGYALPGVCQMFCSSQCSDVAHTDLEHLDIDPLTDFTIFQFSCFHCEGNDGRGWAGCS